MATVWEAVARRPVTVDVGTTVRAAAAEMGRASVGALLVVDGDVLVGIVTDRDIVVRGVAAGLLPEGRIDALMSTDLVTVPASADLSQAHRLLRDRGVRRLPVVDGPRAVGLICVDDLVVRAAGELHDLVQPVAGVLAGHPARLSA